MNASSLEASTPAAAAAPAARRGASAYAKPVLLVVAVLAVAVWLGRLVIHGYHYVETDDAYVVGHLHQISPQLQNQVKEVLVSENQTVKAGDVLVRLDPLESELAVQKSQAELEQARAQEAQTRAKVSRSKADIKTLVTALEVYKLDTNRYLEGLLSTDLTETYIAPAQPMVTQTRAVLERYAANGGSCREVALPEAGHAPHLDEAETFDRELAAHLGV